MDQMEEDVENHDGTLLNGDKNDTDTQRDSRALILKSSHNTRRRAWFVDVREKGYVIKVSEEHFDNVNKQIEARINEFNHAPESAPKVGSYHDGTVILNDPGFVGSGRFKPKEIDESNLKFLKVHLLKVELLQTRKKNKEKLR